MVHLELVGGELTDPGIQCALDVIDSAVCCGCDRGRLPSVGLPYGIIHLGPLRWCGSCGRKLSSRSNQ